MKFLNQLVLYSLEYLATYYPKYIEERYKITISDPETMQEAIGRNRAFLARGGIVDIERTNRMFVNELRGMKIGAMSYDRPEIESI